jgi:ERCC4-type nuclease
MTMFIGPTEPSAFKPHGVSSLITEDYGVDFLWESELGKVGVQRKQFPSDFLASVHDGRLNREYSMMKELDLAILMLEGQPHWTTDGNLVRERNDKRNGWTKTQHRNYCHSVQLRGIHVVYTDNVGDSIQYLLDLQLWSNKVDHNSLDTRPGPVGSGWARVTNVDYQYHLLQGLPGVGPKLAKAIIDTVGMPFGLYVGKEELMKVPGMGKGKAENILRVFNRQVVEEVG